MTLPQDKKTRVIAATIELERGDKVYVRLPPEYYVREIDALTRRYRETGNEDALDSSVGVTFHTIAAMEGDWDNGEDKLEHARKWMGEWFDEFRRRHPTKYQRLVEQSCASSESGPSGTVPSNPASQPTPNDGAAER